MLSESTSSLLVVAGLTKSYDGRTVVADLDLSLNAGSALALMGPNGSGKSTVLRCLSGHEKCRHTLFQIHRQSVQVHSSSYRRHVFPIFDDFSFFPDITMIEHLELLASMNEMPSHESVARAALIRFGMESVTDQFPITLSSGQIRRVAFACAAIREWSVLLLDEPEQRLDSDGRERLALFLEERLAAGRGLVFATHDPALAERLGAVVVHLNRSE
jgi:ABC-type multidrug transport system ATPase subunit